MKSILLCFLLLLLLFCEAGIGASFDCKKATRKVDRIVCASDDLSRLDERVAKFYREAMAGVSNPDEIHSAQRAWLRSRNACKTEACISHEYERRIQELLIHHESTIETGEELINEYVRIRASEIRQILKDKPLYLISPLYNNNPLCASFRDDFKEQQNVELIPPLIKSHDFYNPLFQQNLGDCLLETDPIARRKTIRTHDYLAYKIDINNDNIEETIIVGEYFEAYEYSEKGKKYLTTEPRNDYVAVDEACLLSPLGRAGTAVYTVDAMLKRDDPELPTHGIVRYKGEYFLYEVSKQRKFPPLSIRVITKNDGKFEVDTVCSYDNRSPGEFVDSEASLKGYEKEIRKPTIIGRLNMGKVIGELSVETQLVGNICELRLLRSNATVLQTIDLPKGDWCPNSELFATFDANQDGYDDFVTVSGFGLGPFPFTDAWVYSAKKQQFVKDVKFPGGWPVNKTCTLVQSRIGTGNGQHVYSEDKWCFDGEWREVE